MKTKMNGIDFTDSWVLGWKITEPILEFSVEFSLSADNPLYRTPKKDEWTCYRKGLLRFEGVTAVDGLKEEADVRYSIDPDGSKDFGNIESFEVETDHIHFSGDFGDVRVHCSSWSLQIE